MFIMHKKGFTLTEVIIVLVIIAALALVLVPNIMKAMPDDHSIKYKKAFYTIQEIVSDIANDPSICQGVNASVVDGNIVYTNPSEANKDNILTMCATITTGTNPSVTSKILSDEIYNRLNTDPTGWNISGIFGGVSTRFRRTINGMAWGIPNRQLRDTTNTPWDITIYVDVDGGRTNEVIQPTSRNVANGWYRINVDSTGKVTAPNARNTGEPTSNKTELELLLGNPTD